MNDEMFDDLRESIKEAGEMNDESKKNDKKLSLFEKYMNAVPRGRIQHGDSWTWAAAFKEMLGIIGYEYAHGRRGVTALDNVRRAICDELGLTDNAVAKPDARCPLVFRSDACGVKSSEHYDSCGKTFDDCKKLDNAHNFGAVGYDVIPDAPTTLDDVYAKYVIRCGRYGGYIGETKEATFALRSCGARFTEKQALKFITSNPFELGCDFVVEDAV